MTEHLVGYGYTDDPRRAKSAEQYAIALTACNTLITIANSTRDTELFRTASDQLHRLADEMHSAGMQETWEASDQTYTVIDTNKLKG